MLDNRPQEIAKPHPETGQIQGQADPYPEIVYESFLERSVRSALLIDDQFPMFDTAEEELGNYDQIERAKRLYRTFKERRIVCDIESRAAELAKPESTDRLLKSDLVVLDYHLQKGERNPSKSLKILKSLAESKHFNVVILYTDSENLELVWLEVAGTLKGGWKRAEKILEGDLLENWEALEDEKKLPEVDYGLLSEYLLNGNKALKTPSNAIRQDFLKIGVEKKDCSHFIVARINEEFSKKILIQSDFDIDKCYPVYGSFNEPYWLQSGNLFVAIMKKVNPIEGEANGQAYDPENIWGRLTDCIKAWRPNILQIILSEIQNTLDLDGVTIDPAYTGSPALQAGILYSLFEKIPAGDVETVKNLFKPAVEDITCKLVESIRRKVSTNDEITGIAERLLNYEISRDEWRNVSGDKKKRGHETLSFVKNTLFEGQSIKDDELFFELNSFLSSDEFRGSHLTTGSIFKSDDEDNWWMCCTPACDMEVRRPNVWKENGRDTWHGENYPTKKMLALRLSPVENYQTGLNEANRGQNIYLTVNGNDYRQFEILNPYNHPNWEILIVKNSGKICQTVDEPIKKQFGAYLLQNHREENIDGLEQVECNLITKTFNVVAQLRSEYANRVLQFTGLHLSRIGVDFISKP